MTPKQYSDLPTPDTRVWVSPAYHGLRAHQVCVRKDVPDAEILETVNREYRQRVAGGWHTVVRDAQHARELGLDESAAPGQCAECPDRLHKIVVCL